MSELSTTYMGIPLQNPIVVAASSFSSNIDRIRQIEDLGAGALVIKSLFEEQIRYESKKMEEALAVGAESFAEALSYMPMLEHSGARQHVLWVERTRAAVKMPLIASVNAVTGGGWVEYARQLADAGVNGLELNVYAVEADAERTGAEVEQRLYETVESVRAAVKLPLAVKLSPFYTATANVVAGLQQRGADGVVLFNRFLQPDINVRMEAIRRHMTLSRAEDARLPLRWIALLYGRVDLDLIANTGVDQPEDVIKYLLAGAQAVQVAGALYRHGLPHIGVLRDGLAAWMQEKGYKSLADFRGKVSQKASRSSLYDFERAQYVDFLLSQKG